MPSVVDNYAAIGEESTYGTPVATPAIIQTTSDNWEVTSQTFTNEGYHPGKQAVIDIQHDTIITGATGDISTFIFDKGMGLFLKHVLGSSSVAPLASVTGAHTQTFETNSDGPTTSYTIQLNKVDADSTNRIYTYNGCIPTGFDFSLARDAEPTVTINYDSSAEVISSATTTLATVAARPYTWRNFSMEINNAAIEEIYSFNLTGNLNMKTDRYYLKGNARKAKPVRMGVPEFTGTFEADLVGDTAAVYSLFLAGTPVKVVVTGVHDNVITGSTYPKFTLTMEKCVFTGTTPKSNLGDLSTVSLPFMALWDKTNPVVKLELITSDDDLS